MGWRVKFCNYPELYDVDVLSIIKLRSKGLLGVKAFYREMKKHGISRTKALILQGCYEEGEYEVIGVSKKELERIRKYDTKIVDVYEFRLLITLDYMSKGHELFIEVEVVGEHEKTQGIPIPTENEVMQYLRDTMCEKFEEFMVDFFVHTDVALREMISKANYKCEIEEYKIIDNRVKEIDEELEGEIKEITFKLRRSKSRKWTIRDDLANALWPYMEEGLKDVLDYVMEVEATYLTIAGRKIYEKAREVYKKAHEELLSVKIKRMIEKVRNVSDVFKVEEYLEKLLDEGEISYRDYLDYRLLLFIKAKNIVQQQLIKWIERIDKCKTLNELSELIRRILRTKTYKSIFFDPFRDRLEEEYVRKVNELAKLEIKKGITTKDKAVKSIVMKYVNQITEISDIARKSPHTLGRVIVRLRRIERRVEKSKLPEYAKKEIISAVEKSIEELINQTCDRYRNSIDKAKSIRQLNNLSSEVQKLRKWLKKCYDDLMERIKKKRKELRRREYETIVEEVKVMPITDLKKFVDNVYKLPKSKQYSIFNDLLDRAETLEELFEIWAMISESPLTNTEYYAKLRAKYNEKRYKLMFE